MMPKQNTSTMTTDTPVARRIFRANHIVIHGEDPSAAQEMLTTLCIVGGILLFVFMITAILNRAGKNERETDSTSGCESHVSEIQPPNMQV